MTNETNMNQPLDGSSLPDSFFETPPTHDSRRLCTAKLLLETSIRELMETLGVDRATAKFWLERALEITD